ncbi:ClbS/DfsB family four-helix bundle protein [Arenibacter sp. M-2]|uniref:ClbS/DfsB family four-helix bundle protein n=1 Tax=Arenibacter sp. M-2 TaxID=3053612 RepID=UPI00256FF224|nr:ClbS/DfsB family four-helix bundle protein [Arenibacter sp. M-2]MDL5513918.1 ClbS/DfsB family four-helix bundle protein [Arenibacter sp. M-2]
MARPTNKTELLDLGKKNFELLRDFIDGFSEKGQNSEFPIGTMNRNIRDVLMHLHHWHLMMIDWYTIGMKGEKPEMPAKGYTWRTVPELNRWICEKYKDTSLEDAKKNFNSSYEKVRSLIEKHGDEELFEKKRYKWTGTTSLGAYFVSATSSHYDWAIKLIKKAKK